MKLKSVTLRNFRCYKEPCSVEFGELTAIIGKNDIGKSSILEALAIFFESDHISIDVDDCNVIATDKTIEITCEFTDFPAELSLDTQAQTSLAAEHLLSPHGTLMIKKVYNCSGVKPKETVFVRALHPTTEQYEDLLELTISDLKKRLRELHVSEDNVQLNSNPSIRAAIWRHCPDLMLADVDIPVAKGDGKSIWEKLRGHLPIFALFQSDRASRDSDVEVQDPMKLAVSAALADAGIKQLLDQVSNAVKTKAVEVAQRTHVALSKIDKALADNLVPEFKSEQKWHSLFSVGLSSNNGISINKRGSGVRRLILVSFFRAEAERRMSDNAANNIIYAIEEPETSQHPHNQRMLLESFQELSGESGCQVILTTHSPGFAGLLPIDSFRFVQQQTGGEPIIETATDATWELLVKTLGVVPDNRVKVLLCVEGPSDVTAMKCLSRALHTTNAAVPDLFSDPRVAFVVLGGSTLSQWVAEHFLKGFNRPEVHIYDNDVAKYGDAIAIVNRRGDGSWGALTQKREIENYLHPDAISAGLNIAIAVNDADSIPALVGTAKGWNEKTAKKKLSQYVFPLMTAAYIQARDPQGEVTGWFTRLGTML